MAVIYVVEGASNLDEEIYNQALEYISDERRKKTLKYKRYEDRCRSVVAGVLSKFMINMEYNILIKDVKIGVLDDGKPYYYDIPDKIYFNISHSGDYVVGIIDEYDTGIDVEEISSYDGKIAARFFCKQEYEYICKSDKKSEDFIRFWTIKEAYIKYLSLGLKKGLDTFEIEIKDDNKAFILDKELEKRVEEIVYSCRIDEKFIMSSVSKDVPMIKKIQSFDMIKKYIEGSV